MAVPITNMNVSDILSALGESTSNVTERNLHLSPNVIGTGLDPTYCSGADGYARLANLRDVANMGGIRELRFGKFRNYNPVSVHYKSGYLYNGFCVWPQFGQYGIHVPDGWHIATGNDFLAIINYYEDGNDFSNNTIAKYLRCTYNPADISYPFAYKPVWGSGITKYDSDGFKALATGTSNINFDEDPPLFVWASIGSLIRFWVDDSYLVNAYPLVQMDSLSDRLSYLYVGFSGPPTTYNGRYHFCNIRLVKDDSTDPGFLEDIDGNVYPTIKIGDIVITAESIKTISDTNGDPMQLQPATGELTEPAYYNSLTYDIP